MRGTSVPTPLIDGLKGKGQFRRMGYTTRYRGKIGSRIARYERIRSAAPGNHEYSFPGLKSESDWMTETC